MEMKIPAIAITAVVVVIVLAGVLMPVLDDATAKTDTFTNDGYYRVSELSASDDETITIFWDHTTPDRIYVNDVPMSYADFNLESCSLVFSDNWTVRFLQQGSSTRAIQYYGPTGGDFLGASVTSGTDMTITLSSGTITLVNTAETPVTKTNTYDTVYYIDENGPYTMKKSNQTAYVNPESTIIIANGITTLGSVAYGVYFKGNIEDGLDFNTYAYYSEPSITDVSIVSTDVESHLDLVNLEKVTFTLSNNAGTSSTMATYSYFLVPYEVTAERAVHFSDNESAIFAAIPIMVIVALLIAVVALVFRGRDF